MWPALFGSGWIWSALVAAALLCFIVGVLGFLFLITVRPPRQVSELERDWHLYEEGDLTRSEFERRARRRIREGQGPHPNGNAPASAPSVRVDRGR
jgi:hypothetical protein